MTLYKVYGYDTFSEAWVSVYGANLDSLISQLRDKGLVSIGVEIIEE